MDMFAVFNCCGATNLKMSEKNSFSIATLNVHLWEDAINADNVNRIVKLVKVFSSICKEDFYFVFCMQHDSYTTLNFLLK